MNLNDGFHANNDGFFPYQGAEGIRGLKGGKGEKVNTNHSVGLTGAILLQTEGCNCASERGSLKLWETLNGKTLKCLLGLAVRPSSPWDVMECGTLSKNEALCGDIDLLPFHSGMRVPAACCMCGGRSCISHSVWKGRRWYKLWWVWLHCCMQILLFMQRTCHYWLYYCIRLVYLMALFYAETANGIEFLDWSATMPVSPDRVQYI